MEEVDVQIGEVRVVWSDSAVRCLLAFISANINNVGKTFALKNKAKLWRKGAEELAVERFFLRLHRYVLAFFIYSSCINLQILHIETKFRSIERQYKKRLLNNKQTGRGRMQCPYELELDEIFRDRRGVNPEYTLEVDLTEAVPDLSQMEDSPTMQTTRMLAEVQDETPKKTKKSASQEVVGILKQFEANRKREHEELMAFLKEKEENKDRRAKEKEQFILKLFKDI